MHAKDSAYLLLKGYIRIAKDSLGIDGKETKTRLDNMKTDNKADMKRGNL